MKEIVYCSIKISNLNFIKRIATILICALFSITAIAQEFSISGVVEDDNNQPIPYSNIIVFEADNSESIKGTTSDESGLFKIEGLESKTYVLGISFLGFETHHDTIALNQNVNIKTITLKEKTQELDGITVIGKRPTVKRMVDRLVFNVENSTLSENNVLDVLKHTPGILVHNENITVRSSTPTVYINDRKVHLSSNEIQQLLEGTSATNVKSIEVITNPPARYEAEGGSVINIITSKNIIAGYNGSVYGNFKQGEEFPKFSIGTSHFFKTKKLDAYFNYSTNPRKDYRQIEESINFIENNQQTTSWETDFNRTRKTANHNINANLNYQINDNNSIGFSGNILISPEKHTKLDAHSVTNVFDAVKTLDSTFVSDNNIISKKSNLAFTVDYLHKFQREGEKLSFNAHHTNFDFTSDQNVDTDYFWPDNSLIRNNLFQTLSDQKIKLYSGQLDYELPLSESEQFEAGTKMTNIDSKSEVNQFNFENGEPVIDFQNSDVFLYDELIYAAYASYSKDWDMWSLKAGLRIEYTDIEGNSLLINTSYNNDYLKLFPSVYLLKTFENENQLYFNYNKRIQRPRYRELNPFKYFLNDNTYIVGDPNLKPEIDDVITVGFTFKKDYTFEAYYRYENNPTIELTEQDNANNQVKRVSVNTDRAISYGLDFTTYTQIQPNWNLYATSSVFYYEDQYFSLENKNETLTNEQWSFYTQIINYFSFLEDKSLTADISYLYISSIIQGPVDSSSRSGLDINFRKTFWNKKASVSIGYTDIFNSQNFTQTTKYQDQDIFLKSYMENRMFTFGFNYKFGNFRLDNNKKDLDSSERDRLEGID